jgi:methionyl-tRNA formyltransferase
MSDADIIFPSDGDADALVEELKTRRLDVLLQLGWGMVSRRLLSVPSWGALSWHHGVMPYIRGMVSPVWSIIKNRPAWLGITIQRLEPGIDVGQIVATVRVDPRTVSDYTDAYVALDRAAINALMKAVDDLQAGQDVISDHNPNPNSGVYLNIPGWWQMQVFQWRVSRFFGGKRTASR